MGLNWVVGVYWRAVGGVGSWVFKLGLGGSFKGSFKRLRKSFRAFGAEGFKSKGHGTVALGQSSKVQDSNTARHDAL